MKVRILALMFALATMFGVSVLTASSASAHNYFDTAYPDGGDNVKIWNYWDWDDVSVRQSGSFYFNSAGAVAEWDQSPYTDDLHLRFTTASAADITIIAVPSSYMYYPTAPAETYQTKGVDNLGRAYGESCVIYMNADYFADKPDRKYRQAVVTHELGHCLGFEHSSGTPTYSIMAKSGGTYPPEQWAPTWRDYNELHYHYRYAACGGVGCYG